MKILGISGSSRSEEKSSTYKLVKTTLEATGCEYELISLKGMNISGCIACLGCVKDNICKVKDDMEPLRQKIVEADAYVIGAPNFFSGLNALTHAFLERWYQFRHREGQELWGKLGVAIAASGSGSPHPADEIEKFFLYNFIETSAKVACQGAAACFTCGYGETCKVGAVYFMYGEGFKITEDVIPSVEKQPEVISAARKAGEELGRRLRAGNNRMEVAGKMQQIMMEKFKEAT